VGNHSISGRRIREPKVSKGTGLGCVAFYTGKIRNWRKRVREAIGMDLDITAWGSRKVEFGYLVYQKCESSTRNVAAMVIMIFFLIRWCLLLWFSLRVAVLTSFFGRNKSRFLHGGRHWIRSRCRIGVTALTAQSDISFFF
jgi:hypothetical protein